MSKCKIEFIDFKTDKDEYVLQLHYDAKVIFSGKLKTCGQEQPVNIIITTSKGTKSLKAFHKEPGDFEISTLLRYGDDPSGIYKAIAEYLDEDGSKIYSQQISFKVNRKD